MGNVARVYQLPKYGLENALRDSLNFCVFPGPTFTTKLKRGWGTGKQLLTTATGSVVAKQEARRCNGGKGSARKILIIHSLLLPRK